MSSYPEFNTLQSFHRIDHSCCCELAWGGPVDVTSNNAERDESSLVAAERQRMSRELHNSTSQLLVALQLQLGQLRRYGVPGTEPLLDEIDGVLRDLLASIKQIALPPSGDEENADRTQVEIARAFYSLAKSDPSRP
jgi:signal transduction histidine kinase